MVGKGILGLLLAVFIFSGASHADVPGLDVNDVSILFPLDASGKLPAIKLSLSTTGVRGPLLEKDMFDQQIFKITTTFSGLKTFGQDYGSWRIVGLRYDPCFPSGGEPSECIQQIRLIAQPIVKGALADAALHLLYKIGTGQPKPSDPIIASLMEIKNASLKAGVDTSGLALQVHPGLVAELRKGQTDIADQVVKLITDHIEAAELMKVTFTSQFTNTTPRWVFFGGDVDSGGWSLKPIFNLGGHTSMTMDTGQAVNPEPGTDAPSTAPFFGGVQFSRGPADSLTGPTPEQISGLLSIENPSQSNPLNRDCVSCHSSSALIISKKISFLDGSQANPSAFENPAGVTGFAERNTNSGTPGNTRNFGYFSQAPNSPNLPAISSLTANSSAAVANLANRSQGWANPSSRGCRGPQPKVRECFAGRGPTGTESALACLALCETS